MVKGFFVLYGAREYDMPSVEHECEVRCVGDNVFAAQFSNEIHFRAADVSGVEDGCGVNFSTAC